MENNYKAALKAEKFASQKKLGKVWAWRMPLVKGREADPVGLGPGNPTAVGGQRSGFQGFLLNIRDSM